MKPILHIGYPKTASTWFQQNYYPYVNNATYVDRDIAQKYFIAPGAFEFDINKTKKKFQDFDQSQIIICEELLLGRLKPGGVKGLLTKEIGYRLKQIFPEAKIILFLRNQLDALASSYLQYIKAGGNYGITRFLLRGKESNRPYKRLVLLGPDYFLYHRVIDFYYELFGKENVYIYLYESFSENTQEFIEKFSKEHELEINTDKINYNKLNAGYRRILIPLKKIINCFTRQGSLFKYYIFHLPFVNDYSRYLFNVLNNYKIFGSRPSTNQILGKKNILYLKEYYKESNRMLINNYGLKEIKKYNYPL